MGLKVRLDGGKKGQHVVHAYRLGRGRPVEGNVKCEEGSEIFFARIQVYGGDEARPDYTDKPNP